MTVPKSSKPRERTLADDEIKKFWIACEKVGEPASQCLKLLLLTGCRLNEIAKLRRAEISDKDHTATIPASRTKNKKAFVLPLSPLARNILQSVQTAGDLFFITERGKPLSSWSKIKARLDGAMKIPPWRLHDLRRTFSTNLNKIGIQPHVVEACLNHVTGSSRRAWRAFTINITTCPRKLPRLNVGPIISLVWSKTAPPKSYR